MGGGIVAGFGALLLGSGALMFWGPTNCNLSKDWFCDLPQRLSGLGFLSAGGVQVGIGTIVMAIGAYRARGGGHEANVGHVLGAGKPQWTRLRREDGHLDAIATTDSLLRD